MKMLVIAADGHGTFRCAIVRNPDLFRRDLCTETGAGFILWAAAPVLAINARLAVERISRHVLPRFVAGPELQYDLAFVSAVAWITLGRPLLGVAARQMRRWARRIIRSIPMARRLGALLPMGQSGGRR